MTQMPLVPPGDDEARSHIREDLSSTLLVEAGAGTGKTSALVDRVVALVLHGTPVERIAAITFTEKAATELRDRVRSGLEKALEEGVSQTDRVVAALQSLERAQISTIHAFGQALLRDYAAHAGIDPSFTVIDEVQAERRHQERWRLYLDDLGHDATASAVVQRALGLGMTPRDIESLASRLAARSEVIELIRQRPPLAPTPMWPDVTQFCSLLEEVDLSTVPVDDRLRIRVDYLLSLLRQISAARREDRETVLASAAGLLKATINIGRAESWGGRIENVRSRAAGICESLNDLLFKCRQEALAHLLPLIVQFVEREATERGRDGELTFDDLILRTRDLLHSDPETAAALRERFDALLIDEFQDTDPLQVDIALSFARHPGTGRLEGGRLFMVGDPKQSIYRFRRADMGVYARTRELVLRDGGKFPELAQNRRSRPEILDWVNRVFAILIGSGDHPEIQPPYNPIMEYRKATLRGPAVGFFGGEAAPGFNARQVRQIETGEAAALCSSVITDGWEVWDAVEEAPRQARYRDIAVLIPSRNVLVPLERALAEAGVPYRVEGGSLVYRTQEVRDVLNCLSAINDPADEVAVVAALRSPAFACSDTELVQHRMSGGFFDYLREPGTGLARVSDALAVLARYHRERHQGSIAALVERFVAERGLVEVGILDRGDRNSFRRMRFVVEQARAFESSGPESLREFVAWMERRSSRDILDNEGAGLDDDEDAVRILTIHGAKGLEFPIVVMAGMGTYPVHRPDNYLADHGTGEFGVWIGSEGSNRRFSLGDCGHLTNTDRLHNEAEFSRLLYVAATRARDHLLVSLHRSVRATTSAAARLEAAGAKDAAEPLNAPPRVPAARTGPLDELELDPPRVDGLEAFQAARDELVAKARGRLFTSATAEVRETQEQGSRKEDNDDPAEPWARGRGGSRLGRAVHASIQSLPLDADDETITAFSRAQAVAEAIPQRAAEAARLVQRALQSEAAARARDASRALREVPFAVQTGAVTLEGFIDLVIETPEGLEVVDWKTDQIGAGDVEARLDEYRLQAGLYVWGLEEATGRRVHRVTYVFASAGRELSPGEPAGLAEAARRHLSGRIAAPPPS
jgi:ATP-dependent helicase/nuclease subunit A